jgi:hypothetical protein
MLHSLSPKRPPRKIPHSFGFIIKPDLVYAARLAAAKRLSYSHADIWNQLARWQPWSSLVLSENQKDGALLERNISTTSYRDDITRKREPKWDSASIFQNLHPPLHHHNCVRVHPNAIPQHMKVLKHFINVYYGCVMQSGVVYSLNKNDTTMSF